MEEFRQDVVKDHHTGYYLFRKFPTNNFFKTRRRYRSMCF